MKTEQGSVHRQNKGVYIDRTRECTKTEQDSV